MNATLIERQVEAFSDSMLEQVRDADACNSVEDAVLIATNLCKTLVELERRKIEKGATPNPLFTELFVRLVKMMIKSTSILQREAMELQKKGFAIQGTTELAEMLYQSRELLVSLTDDTEFKLPDYEEFREVAKTSPPPQSWYEEDASQELTHHFPRPSSASKLPSSNSTILNTTSSTGRTFPSTSGSKIIAGNPHRPR